jgi:hypothetical protein
MLRLEPSRYAAACAWWTMVPLCRPVSRKNGVQPIDAIIAYLHGFARFNSGPKHLRMRPSSPATAG